MEPRFGDRGTDEAPLPRAIKKKRQLQWSRGSVTAERRGPADHGVAALCLASMEPRFGDRGTHCAGNQDRRLSRLQWSRGSVTAERSSVKTLTCEIIGFNGARFGDRGTLGLLRPVREGDRASMEPRFGDRGTAEVLQVDLGWLMLQWSRGSVTAERELAQECLCNRVQACFNGAAVR